MCLAIKYRSVVYNLLFSLLFFIASSLSPTRSACSASLFSSACLGWNKRNESIAASENCRKMQWTETKGCAQNECLREPRYGWIWFFFLTSEILYTMPACLSVVGKESIRRTRFRIRTNMPIGYRLLLSHPFPMAYACVRAGVLACVCLCFRRAFWYFILPTDAFSMAHNGLACRRTPYYYHTRFHSFRFRLRKCIFFPYFLSRSLAVPYTNTHTYMYVQTYFQMRINGM